MLNDLCARVFIYPESELFPENVCHFFKSFNSYFDRQQSRKLLVEYNYTSVISQPFNNNVINDFPTSLNSIKVFIIRWSKTFLIFIISHFLCPLKWIITIWYWFFLLQQTSPQLRSIRRWFQWRMFCITRVLQRINLNQVDFPCSIYIILNFLHWIPFRFGIADNWMDLLLLFVICRYNYWLWFLKSTIPKGWLTKFQITKLHEWCKNCVWFTIAMWKWLKNYVHLLHYFTSILHSTSAHQL